MQKIIFTICLSRQMRHFLHSKIAFKWKYIYIYADMLRRTTKKLYEKEQPAFCCQKSNSKWRPSDLCDQQKQPHKILLRVLRSGSLRVHMGDKATETNEGMCNQGGFDSLMHVRALNGSNNIQKLLFSGAGGRCWEILQSMWVVAREGQEIRKRRKKKEKKSRECETVLRHHFPESRTSRRERSSPPALR